MGNSCLSSLLQILWHSGGKKGRKGSQQQYSFGQSLPKNNLKGRRGSMMLGFQQTPRNHSLFLSSSGVYSAYVSSLSGHFSLQTGPGMGRKGFRHGCCFRRGWPWRPCPCALGTCPSPRLAGLALAAAPSHAWGCILSRLLTITHASVLRHTGR